MISKDYLIKATKTVPPELMHLIDQDTHYPFVLCLTAEHWGRVVAAVVYCARTVEVVWEHEAYAAQEVSDLLLELLKDKVTLLGMSIFSVTPKTVSNLQITLQSIAK
jgi:hypothetical protein